MAWGFGGNFGEGRRGAVGRGEKEIGFRVFFWRGEPIREREREKKKKRV